MKLILNVDYRTNWGESIYITGNIPALGNSQPAKALPMTLDGEQHWFIELQLPDKCRRFSYRYMVHNDADGTTTRNEWGPDHTFFATPEAAEVIVYDRWQDMPFDKPFYSSAFVDCICARHGKDSPLMFTEGRLTLRVSAPLVAPDETLGIIGDGELFGNWDESRVVKMNNAEFPLWNVSLQLDKLSFPFEYKFVIIDAATGAIKAWEGGENRRLVVNPSPEGKAVVMGGMRYINPRNPWHGAGLAIPVFSLRSDEDFGVGDFYDLKKMVDWAVKTGQKFIQILPINDTTMTHTWTDSYPYNANSTFALHPMYLRLEAVGELNDENRRHYYSDLKHELSLSETVEYERVNNAKMAYLREIYEQNAGATIENADYQKFVERNLSWLKPYAAFCVLRDKFETPEFDRWGDMAVYDEPKVDAFVEANQKEIHFVYFLQYHLDKQMREVSRYAHEHGVALKGDIPIGISRTSADAWLSPRLFNLDCQAGAPPDDFSVLGQNWGFPTYNWEEMARDGYAWWKSRFQKMAEYFDAYRIDHVLGFFRIWQIPMSAVHGLLGIFNPALPFTVDELKYNYDFWLDVDLHTKPYITDELLGRFFGEYAGDAREYYLDSIGYGRYQFRPEFDTQRKVIDYFAQIDPTEKTARLCDAMLMLHDEVLFIEDPVEKGKYHPRISAQSTALYQTMNDYERWCFNHLYNDFFYQRHNDFWYRKAMEKLPPLIDATPMLVCAEDLGMIPHCVPAVMEKLEIISLEIQRMPKDPNTEFGNTWSYPYYSVCTTSTHDMGGIRQWWEEDRAKTQRFYNGWLHEHGEAPYYAEPWICDKIIDQHLDSPSMLCILPLQDWLSLDGVIRREDPRDELINIPANPRHYWRYRMHLTLEQLLNATTFNDYLENKIKDHNR